MHLLVDDDAELVHLNYIYVTNKTVHMMFPLQGLMVLLAKMKK